MTYVGAGANDQQLRPGPQLPGNATGVAFYSTQDADPTPLRPWDGRSEGEEGKFRVWTPDEIREVLGSEADELIAAYGVTRKATLRARASSNSSATWTSARRWRRHAASYRQVAECSAEFLLRE